MPKLEFEIWCDSCGEELSSQTIVNGKKVFIKPCPNCLTVAYDVGRLKVPSE